SYRPALDRAPHVAQPAPMSLAHHLRALVALLLVATLAACEEMPPSVGADAGPEPPADADGDGITDELEHPGRDADGDGTPDYLDSDSDDDGISDAEESGGEEPPRDSDDDGLPDFVDLDSDDNGIGDAEEPEGDLDGDGLADRIDPDDDGDLLHDA